MKRFPSSVHRLLRRNVVSCTYTSNGAETYDTATGINSIAVTTKIIKTYPRQIQASQYNFPKLIGKEVIMFYVEASEVTPKIDDSITYNSKTYLIDHYQEHSVGGEIVLYRVITTRV